MPDETLLKCGHCSSLYEEHLGELREVKIEYAMPPFHGREYINLPFWSFLPDIKIFRRSIDKKSFLDAPADTLKNRLFSPAFKFIDIKAITNLCAFLTMNNPKYKTTAPYNFLPCIYSHFSAHRIARSVFLIIEVQEKDKIFGMDYELLLVDPKLVILPFEVKGSNLVSPFIHFEIPRNAIGT